MGDFWVDSTHPEDIADGRTFGPGEKATRVDEKHPHNAALIDIGRLIPIPIVKPTPAAKKKETNE